ncbi:MAG TPA: ribonuclease H-like YkuK family protein [Bacillota bacterium]|nr:ribonuclease H-like YkuK family protein [Bacillota bacterium]HPT86486.1 ribonuclease H-like YkuK family protein [Bacillota bacterium]
MIFISPTKGKLTLYQVSRDLAGFVAANPESSFKLIVGTDSQLREEVCYVTAIIILREGKGGRFYYAKEYERTKPSLKERIFYEASKSLHVAAELTRYLSDTDITCLDVEIHLDVGVHGKTKEIIREVVGMVTGSGFGAKIKPMAYGASKVADKYTK